MTIKKEHNLYISIIFFLSGTLFIIFYTFIDHYIFSNQFMKFTIANMEKKLFERERVFQRELDKVSYKLYAIRENPFFLDYIKNIDNRYAKQNLSHLFEDIIDSHGDIMQIRYIDEKGKEKIRFDRLEAYDKKYFQAKELQDKSSRSYFIQSIDKGEKVWFSKLDLNIENGKIEIPFRPTFRAILPIRYKSQFKGIIIINYFAKSILNRIFDEPLYDAILTDKEGYILKHFDPVEDWSRYQKPSYKLDRSTLYKDRVSKKLDLPFVNQLMLTLQLKKDFIHKRHQFYIERAFWVIFVFVSLIFLLSNVLYMILKYLNKQNVSIEILTKEKKEQNTLLIQNAKMAALGEMLSNIAHQWRQPLSIISMYCIGLQQRYERKTLDDNYFQNFIQKVNGTIEQMSDTIEDFSSFFKPHKKKENFEINLMIQEALNLLEKPLADNNIMVCFDPLEKFEFYGYKNELKQIIFNIINNSKDAIQSNGIALGKINVLIKRDNEKVIIRIEDNAGGVSLDIIKRVYEPYFTTKHKSNGTGIGLYMCKMIIEESFGGSIRLFNYKQGVVNEIILSSYKEGL